MSKSMIAALLALPLVVAVPATAQQGSPSPQQAQPGQGNAAVQLSQDQVRQLQQALNDHGFDAGEVDGVMGARTSAALKRFQSKAGLKPTGQIDQQTLALVGLSGQAQQPAGQPQSTGQGGTSGQPASPDQSSGRGSQGDQQDSPGPQNQRMPER
jgi:peptidoglycan hydrolase-like protein with peptidoglycan-binding domain